MAFVSNDIAAENSNVNIINTPIAENIDRVFPKLVKRYIATTGRTRRTKMTLVMMKPTSFSTRDGEK